MILLLCNLTDFDGRFKWHYIPECITKQKLHSSHCDLISDCLPTLHMITASKSDFPHAGQIIPVMLVAGHLASDIWYSFILDQKKQIFCRNNSNFLWNVCYNNDINYIYPGYKNSKDILTLQKCSQ
jgi:hypothetical protein